jgi:hypothetical protein
MADRVEIGAVFGILTVQQKATSGWARWVCVCACGEVKILAANKLLSGNNRSCGCLKREALGNATRTHGRSNSKVTGYKDRTYGIWQAMRDRCSNSNRADWYRYGGAGVTVAPEWNEFIVFLADMGSAPAGMTLDRIDGSLGYSKENCRWATYKEQAINSSRAIVYTIGNKRDSISGWAKTWGVNRKKAKRMLACESGMGATYGDC